MAHINKDLPSAAKAGEVDGHDGTAEALPLRNDSLTRVLRTAALATVVAVVGGVLYGGRVLAAWQHDHSNASQASTDPRLPEEGRRGAPNSTPNSGERTVLYWYDAMDPQHHYDKPGKAPDGMDLVAKYADQGNPPAQSVTATASKGEPKILYWYDPMHPQYKADKPGKAPDCGMDLVPKYAEELSHPVASNPDATRVGQPEPGTVTIAADKQQLIGVRTAEVRRESLVREVRTTGQVTTDESRIAHVHVKVNGFIDKVFVDYIGQLVKKGQPLFTLYSADLVASQNEYLIAKRGEKTLGGSAFAEVAQGSQSLLRSARERLKLWDISDDQIATLDETGEVHRTLTFYSPIAGFVTDRKAFPNTSVNPDTELYTVADLSSVWVNADVYEYEVPYVKVGQQAEMQLSYYPGRTWHGRVSFIYPTVDPTTRTVKVRLEFANPNFELKPQMFTEVRLKVNYGNQIVVAQEAVLDSGKEQTVFVAHEGGHFEPRKITTGAKLDGKVVVVSGLKAGETVVTSGNFLLDSESKLKSATDEMQH